MYIPSVFDYNTNTVFRYKKYSNDHFDNNSKKEQGNLSQRTKILKLYSNEMYVLRIFLNKTFLFCNNIFVFSAKCTKCK